MEPIGSLPHLLDPAACTYPEQYINTSRNTVNKRRNWRECMKVI